MIYRVLTAAGLLLMIAVQVNFCRKNGPDLLTYFKNRLRIVKLSRLTAYLLGLASFMILALSAMVPVILGTDYLTGIMLIFHVTFAPVFAGMVAVFMILTGHHMTFSRQDLLAVRNRWLHLHSFFWQKIIFWLFCICAVFTAVSIILMLFPLFGTEGQQLLIAIHRSAALLLVILAALHFWLFESLDRVDNS